MLLTQFDENKSAIINPGAGMDMVDNFPETVVAIFSHQLFQAILDFLGRHRRFGGVR